MSFDLNILDDLMESDKEKGDTRIIEWASPTLYSRNVNGSVQIWEIEVSGSKYRTITGQLDGKKTTSEWTLAKGKNKGKKNETSDAEQALKEAKARFKKKKEANFFVDIKDIDKELFIDPMKAIAWEKQKDKIEYPVYVQRKYDGIRCIARKSGLWSRNGKEIVSCPHVWRRLKPLFDLFPDLIIDGELYADKYNNDFNAICSLVKKTKLTPEDFIDSENSIDYHVYDIVDLDETAKFSIRNRSLKNHIESLEDKRNIVFVETFIANNEEDVDNFHIKFVEDGFEGSMIRIDAPYLCKRTKNLLKRKDFIDEEFKIIRIHEGNGNRSGMAGNIEFKTKNGDHFTANIKGGFDFYRELLINQEEYIGKMATVQFFQYTPDGIPRFPVVTAVRDYE